MMVYFKKMITSLALVGMLCLPTASLFAQMQGEVLNLNLEQALDIAVSKNPTIQVAGQEIELKKAQRREAIGGLIPEVSLQGSYSRAIKKQKMAMEFGGESTTIEVGRDNTYNGGLVINFPIFAPALYKSINMSKADLELAVEKARASEIDLINEVTKAYYQVLLTQDSYEVLLKSYNQAKANFDVVEAKYKQGSVSEYDKIRAEVQVRNIKPSVVSAKNGVNLAKLQLKVLMGISSEYDVAITDNLSHYEATMYGEILDRSAFDLSNNSDLMQLDLNTKILSENVKLQRTNYLPQLSASFNYTYLSMNDDFRIAHYRWFPSSSIAVNLSIPLFKASSYAKSKQAKVQLQQMAYTRTNIERKVDMQVQSYLDNMSASSEQVMSNKEGILQAQKGRDIAQKRYEVGKGTILELNDSEVALTEASLTYNQSIYDYLVAKAELDKVLGINKSTIKNK